MTKRAKQQEKRLSQSVQEANINRKDFKATKAGAKKDNAPAPLFQKLFGAKSPPQTAQQSIPYRTMYRDGVCRVTDRLYSKTIWFGDINYHLAQNEDKTQIFESYCDFLNYFDSTIHVQLSFINKFGNLREFEQSISIADQADEFNSIRREYSDMLKSQLSKGNNGLVKQKYITFGIEADSLKEAKPRLERIELELIQALFFSNGGSGMAERECADLFGVSQPNVNQRKRRILAKLRNILGN